MLNHMHFEPLCGTDCRWPLANFANLRYKDLDAERRLKEGTLVSWFEGKGDEEYDSAPLHFFEYFGSSVRNRIRGLARTGQLMSAYQTALESLVEIEARKERMLVDGIADKEREEEGAR